MNGEAAYVEVMGVGEVVSRHGGGGRKGCDGPTRGVQALPVMTRRLFGRLFGFRAGIYSIFVWS